MPAMTAKMRWLIGGGVAVAAIAIAVGAALVLSGRSMPEAARYIPSGSPMVAELRLDLPGDQFQKVGNLLSHFPGFADQSTLGAKLDETLDRAARAASGGSVDYTTKLKPWLAGPTFVAVLGTSGGSGASEEPAASASGGASRPPGPTDGVVVTTTDGKVTCDAAIPNGTKVSLGGSDQLTVASSGDMACFMDGKYGLLGTKAGIQAALAAHRNGAGLDHDARYAKARDSLGGDRIATVYVSGSAANLMQQAEASLPASLPIPFVSARSLPDWLIAGIRAEDDALVTDILVAPPSGAAATAAASPLPTLPPPHASQIAAFLPGNTVLLAEGHGVGIAAQAAIAALRSDPQFQAQARQLDAAISAAGGAEGLVGWISDAGVAVVPQATSVAGTGPGVDVGLVLVASDEATATSKAGQIKSLLSLAALGSGGTADDVQIDGTTVTTIDLGNLSSLINAAGAGSQLGGVTLPTDLHVKVSLAVRGKLVLLGGDDAFARDVLGVEAGGTLADQAAYKRSLDRAAASNLGQLYVAGDPLRALATTLLPADLQSRWQTDIRPYAASIDAILATTTIENGLSHTRLVVTVSTPAATPGGSTGPIVSASP